MHPNQKWKECRGQVGCTCFCGSADGWSGVAELSPSDLTENNLFGDGIAVSANGARIAVGAPWGVCTARGCGSHKPATYVFTEPAGGWTDAGAVTPAAKLVARDEPSGEISAFGAAVAISSDGSTVFVGAYGRDEGYVFVEPSAGWTGTLTQAARLKAGVPGTIFGESGSISANGTTVLVGDRGESVYGYVFTEPRDGWASDGEASFVAASATLPTAEEDGGGVTVSLSADGDTALIGAPGFGISKTSGRLGTGGAFVFENRDGTWKQTAQLVAPGLTAGADFGLSIAISPDKSAILLGAPDQAVNGEEAAGAAYEYIPGARTGWELRNEFYNPLEGDVGSNEGAIFGFHVFVSAEVEEHHVVVIGAPDAASGDSLYTYLTFSVPLNIKKVSPKKAPSPDLALSSCGPGFRGR